MKIIIASVAALLLMGCAATTKPSPKLDVVALSKVIDGLAGKDNLLIEGFKELEARIRAIEGKLKIQSPVIPEQKK
jgi:hypothetical protein